MENIDKIVKKRTRFGISRGWVTPVSRRRSRWTIILEIFGKNLRDYCENSSLVGYRYLGEPDRSWIERIMWIILHAATICILGLLVNSAYREYIDLPVVTVVASDSYPTGELEFPGIAICNINRISRKAAIEFTNEIVSSNVTSLKFMEVLHLVRQFGALYDSNAEPNKTLETYLDQLLLKYYEGHYDVTSIMKSLSPSCADGLLSCYFRGELKNCMDIFVFRKTQDGYCCTFNYARESDDISTNDGIKMNVPVEPYRIKSLGISNGLTLVMEPFLEDYYYPMLPIIGWKVTVFNARDYPDNQSGSVAEALLSPATETFLELDVTSFYSNDETRSVSVEERKCIFEDELSVLYGGYTYSDCLVDCRAAAIWDTCKCRPFFLPRRGNDQYTRKVCDTRDAACLHENKDMYSRLVASKYQNNEKDEIKYEINPEIAKRCSDCYPACNDVHYYLRSSTMHVNGRTYHTELLNNIELINQSIVHIYFTKHGSVRMRQEAAYYWYELLSNIGGICGLFIGFSLISVLEFLYFALCMIRDICRGKRDTITIEDTTRTSTRRTGIRTKRRKIENAKRFAGNLYWNEFLAHSVVTLQDGKIQRLQVRKY